MLNNLELKIPPVIVFIVALLLTGYCATIELMPLPHPLRPFGFVVFVAGGLIGVAGVVAFRQQHTTVNPHRPQNTSRLVDGGIFAYTRNPMYLGLVIGVVGAAFIVRDASGFVFALLTMAYLQRFQIIPEERFMLKLFGDEFSQYCQRTKRWYGHQH